MRMTGRGYAADIARRDDARIVGMVRSVLGSAWLGVRPALLWSMMVLAIMTGASAIGSPAQARTETFSQGGETIRRGVSDDYSAVSANQLTHYPDIGGTYVSVFYSVISIPGGKLYASANIDYRHGVAYGSGLPVNISLMSSRPTIDAAGFN